ncbi:hypothetical protein F5Y15DRAFT_214193 [Xylariaceae sp. FL0016]|nr:hypothetical protein F5Y15DRAFT_214193 [Xylariaceae sp. FL0016]
MPYFRGIQISIISGQEARHLPEYPHPDASSVRVIKGLNAPSAHYKSRLHQHLDLSASSNAKDNDPSRHTKVNPRVSVYIPSLPGQQFWLHYSVNQYPPPSRCIFFKLFVNGGHVVSWGIDATHCSSGSVTKALYEPHGRRKGRIDAFDPNIEADIEWRSFYFMLGLDKKSAAQDGGLIEVQVFRCKSRKRVATKLDRYREPKEYGITYLSGGYVDSSDDATYYDYHLIDAKNSPYATFCFHYRSTKYLEQLNLIPQPESLVDEPTPMDSQCAPFMSTQRSLMHEPVLHPTQQFAFGVESLDTRAFDIDPNTVGLAISDPSGIPKLDQYCWQDPPHFLPPSPPEIPEFPFRTPPKVQGKGDCTKEVLRRPLPDPPRPQSRRSSVSSLRSNCPSLTPSLKQYAESDDFEQEEIRLSMAQPLLIPSESMQALELGTENHGEESSSVSDYTASPSSTEASQSPKLPSPDGYIPTTGSVLESHIMQFDSPDGKPSPSKGRNRIALSSSENALILGRRLSQPDALKFTETEWLRRTPSPMLETGNQASRLWSPRPERRSIDDSPRESQCLSEDGHKAVQDNHSFDERNSRLVHEVPAGNWI